MNVMILGVLLILVASMTVAGMTGSVSAQDDPAVLLKIAKRAQEQIQDQISDDSTDRIKQMFEEGTNRVNALEQASQDGQVEMAKENFLSAMDIFKEILEDLATSDEAATASDRAMADSADSSKSSSSSSNNNNVPDPSNDFQRLEGYVYNLKTIAQKHDSTIDFTELNKLFLGARVSILAGNFALATETLHQIKVITEGINQDLQKEAAIQESQRAIQYAQKYLEQLDRLIEHAKKQGVAAEIIDKLETAQETLSSTDNPREIVKEIKKIMSLKDQFELTSNDMLESRVLRAEKSISKLSEGGADSDDTLEGAREALQDIKGYLADGDLDSAGQLLDDLEEHLQEIRDSL